MCGANKGKFALDQDGEKVGWRISDAHVMCRSQRELLMPNFPAKTITLLALAGWVVRM